MSAPLKPISEAMRKALALLGETPQEHQEEVRRKGKPPKLPEEHKLTPSAVIAARWQSPSWRPEARVLFLRRSVCLKCGQTDESQHWPETFIRERLKGHPNEVRYLPSRSSVASSIELPLVVEFVHVKQYTCRHCPEWAAYPHEAPKEQSLCLSDILTSRLATIASSQSPGGTTSSTSAERPSTSERESEPRQITGQGNLVSSEASPLGPSSEETNLQPKSTSTLGLCSVSADTDQFALVTLTPSHTISAKASVPADLSPSDPYTLN